MPTDMRPMFSSFRYTKDNVRMDYESFTRFGDKAHYLELCICDYPLIQHVKGRCVYHAGVFKPLENTYVDVGYSSINNGFVVNITGPLYLSGYRNKIHTFTLLELQDLLKTKL